MINKNLKSDSALQSPTGRNKASKKASAIFSLFCLALLSMGQSEKALTNTNSASAPTNKVILVQAKQNTSSKEASKKITKKAANTLPSTTTLSVAPSEAQSSVENTYSNNQSGNVVVVQPNTLSGGRIEYKGETRYYVSPAGKAFLDKRKVGPIYPNLFDVARKGYSQDYIATEDEDRGCNLEAMFLKTVYKKYGFDVRRYLNALATTSCASLPSAEEQSLCKQFHETPVCSGATPVVFEVLPLKTNENYLTYLRKKPFPCEAEVASILKDTYVSKQSKEWSKIEGDLIEKKRTEYTNSLKAKAPVGQIKQSVYASNKVASQRDVDFAINEWIYNEGKKASFNVSDSEIIPIVEKRYSPSSAMKNILEFKNEIGGKCAGKEARYNSKVYAEGMNIPAHHILSYADFIDKSNACICK